MVKDRSNRARADLAAMHLFEKVSAIEPLEDRLAQAAGAFLPLAVRRKTLLMIKLESSAANVLHDPTRAIIAGEYSD